MKVREWERDGEDRKMHKPSKEADFGAWSSVRELGEQHELTRFWSVVHGDGKSSSLRVVLEVK